MFLCKVMSKNMAQVFKYNSEKMLLKSCYNFEIQDALPPCFELNKILNR